MTPGEMYLLAFYFRDADDLGMPDVHWGGGLAEAIDWATKRLEHLGTVARPADQLSPIFCEVRDQGGALMCRIGMEFNGFCEVSSMASMTHGITMPC